MRTAVIADIHANVEALEAVLEVASTLDIDRYVCLGDVVGYGAQPNEACDHVRALGALTILGNHDAAVARSFDEKLYGEAVLQSLRWTSGALTDDHRSWLATLPYIEREATATFCHGLPLRPAAFEYLFFVDQVEELDERRDDLTRLTFIGHSHLALCLAMPARAEPSLTKDERCNVEGDSHFVITVGSVGQPRDRDPRACFVVWDSDEHEVMFHRVPYDIDAAADKIRSAGLPEIFADRLRAGI